MAVQPDPQTSIGETDVDVPGLEQLLEHRESRKAFAAKARKSYKESDERVRAELATLDLGDDLVRVGRFVITKTEVAARAVAFETDPTTRLTISVAKDT